MSVLSPPLVATLTKEQVEHYYVKAIAKKHVAETQCGCVLSIRSADKTTRYPRIVIKTAEKTSTVPVAHIVAQHAKPHPQHPYVRYTLDHICGNKYCIAHVAWGLHSVNIDRVRCHEFEGVANCAHEPKCIARPDMAEMIKIYYEARREAIPAHLLARARVKKVSVFSVREVPPRKLHMLCKRVESPRYAVLVYGCLISTLGTFSKRPRLHAGKTCPATHIVLAARGYTEPAPLSEAAHRCGCGRCVNIKHLAWQTAQYNAEQQDCHDTGAHQCTHEPRCTIAPSKETVKRMFLQHRDLNGLPRTGRIDKQRVSLCELCGNTFADDTALYLHQNFVHWKRVMMCSHVDTCTFVATSVEAMQLHYTTKSHGDGELAANSPFKDTDDTPRSKRERAVKRARQPIWHEEDAVYIDDSSDEELESSDTSTEYSESE